jgi:hypothetical protein
MGASKSQKVSLEAAMRDGLANGNENSQGYRTGDSTKFYNLEVDTLRRFVSISRSFLLLGLSLQKISTPGSPKRFRGIQPHGGPMRVGRCLLPFIFVLSFSIPLIPSAAQTASPQAVQYLQKALAVLSGNTPTTDVTLTGTARRIAGSDDETGTATLKAVAGASRIDLNLSSGPRSEVINTSAASLGGMWSSPDGVTHPISYNNLFLVDPAWYFPAFPISRGLATGYAASYIGHETRNNQAVEHISLSHPLAAAAAPYVVRTGLYGAAVGLDYVAGKALYSEIAAIKNGQCKP